MSRLRSSRLHAGSFAARVALCAVLVFMPGVVSAQVLGGCGTPSENSPAVAPTDGTGAMVSSRMPLPGEHAINFELPAVIGDEIEMVKLSDFNGKWRVVCFYPADFTFV